MIFVKTSRISLVYYFIALSLSDILNIFYQGSTFSVSISDSFFLAHGLISISQCQDFSRIYILSKIPQLIIKLLPVLECRYLNLWHLLCQKSSKWSFQHQHNSVIYGAFPTGFEPFTFVSKVEGRFLNFFDSKLLYHSLGSAIRKAL